MTTHYDDDDIRSTATSSNERKKRRRFQFANTPMSFRSSKASINSWREKRINWIRQLHLPDFETKIHCNQCEKYVQTRIRYKNGSMVYLMSFILLLCTVFLFWVPFYVKYFKDVAHYCPGCGKCLGVSYKL